MREYDRRELQRAFATLPSAERRQVLRAVSRGTDPPSRALARVTIGVARRQQRFWRVAWLMGPAFGLIQLAYVPLEQALVNVTIGTAVLGAMSAWWLGRARRAEARARAMLSEAIGPGRIGPPSPALPRSGPRPPRPRGRKRG